MSFRIFPILGICVSLVAFGQTPASAPVPNLPNSDPVYRQLRQISGGSESSAANNLVLKRDAGAFTFRTGTFYFLAPVEGKVTGAVFIGDGLFSLEPPNESERRSLRLLTRGSEMVEQFSEAVLRFTDGTYDEIKKAGGVSTSGVRNGTGLLQDSQDALRKKLHYNLTARILQDVLSPEPGGLFYAFIKGKRYNGQMLFAIDPHGVSAAGVEPEEIALLTYDDNKWGTWAAFHYANEVATGKASSSERNALIQIEKQELDVTIDKGGRLDGTAITTFVAQKNGTRVVSFDLYPTLRVQSVAEPGGQSLAFIQEEKNDDPDFNVVLPKALSAGQEFTIATRYNGKDAVSNQGGGNYYVSGGARDSWYPNSKFGDYAHYVMKLRIPKGLRMVASGTLVGETTEGNQSISEWKTEVPQAVAGFNFGKFKRQEARLEKDGYLVESYANEAEPDIVRSIKQQGDLADLAGGTGMGSHLGGVEALGNMSTLGMAKKALAEAQLSMGLYTDYFGASPYKRVAMTQQTAGDYGQAWPGLVYLPITSFFDSTTRHGLGMDDPEGYFKVVGPHEVAHQWWGHLVGFNSYRDQWMSEGFADFSASLFLQQVYGVDQYQKFWRDEYELLTTRNKEGFRPIDVAPVTMGYRASNSKAGFNIGSSLIYPKGAYILHMLRMLMWSPQTGDQNFKVMMRAFTQTYANRVATTEDFKAFVEKYMPAELDLMGNHRMDWFFDPYVYGTALPNYKLEHSFENTANGTTLNIKVTQSNVDQNFSMRVPLYIEFVSGKVVRLGVATMVGNTTVQQQIPLGTLKDKPKRAVLNYYSDVLCTEDN
jgi:Peptidase family M1 domain